jgi:SAM-dependent methyltransferase
MMPGYFSSSDDSHLHSLDTLNALYEYDDFMESIETLADMGCGQGLDLEWWATRTSRDERQEPLNIKCTGIDIATELSVAQRYRNITYVPQDFEEPIRHGKKTYDVVWCHDAFQYVASPFTTLANWWNSMSPDGMLVIIVPQTTNLEFNIQAFDQRDYCYHNWTMVNLIHTLAVSGFDCGGGFFKKQPDDPWLHAVVYKSEHSPMDPRITSWYQLADLGLLPTSAAHSLNKYGHVRQRDLVLPWLDKSISQMSNQ